MIEFDFGGFTYRVQPDGSVLYYTGLRWFFSGLGSLSEIRERAASNKYNELKHLSREFLKVYDKVAVKHPSEVF